MSRIAPPSVRFGYANNIQLFAPLIDVFEENSTSLEARMSSQKRTKMTPHPSADKRLPPSPTGEGYLLLWFQNFVFALLA